MSRPVRVILLVDDDPNLRRTMTDILRVKGYDPYDVATGAEALAFVEKVEPAVAVLDMRLGDMPGLDVLREIKSRSPLTEAIVLTGHGSEETAMAVMNSGAYSYLKKPLDIDQFLILLDRALERRQTELALYESERRYRTLTEVSPVGIFRANARGLTSYVNPKWSEFSGLNRLEAMGNGWLKGVHPEDRAALEAGWNEVVARRAKSTSEYRFIHPDGRTVWVFGQAVPEFDDAGEFLGYIGTIVDITERKQAEERIKFQANLLSVVGNAVIATDLQGRVTYWNRAAEKLYGWSAAETLGSQILDLTPAKQTLEQAREIMARMTQMQSWSGEFTVRRKDGSEFPAFVLDSPIADAKGNLIGIIGVSYDITERRQSERRIQRQIGHLKALREIDMIITSSFSLRVNLEQIVRHATRELEADAAAILLFTPGLNTLGYIVGHGFYSAAVERAELRVGEGHAGQAALSRKLTRVADLRTQPDHPARASLLTDEGFVSYFCAPLVAKGFLQGTLEIFHRSPFDPDEEWLDFLNTLAGQTAIAIESSVSYEKLETLNTNLILAYDATIEGWSRAMDLRDEETEGHTRRVTDLTIKLAQTAGIKGEKLLRIKRGALLHDMGKMGVPDHILLKPGKLTEEEWEIMRKHPQFAYDMLAPISYLRPALEIPYCHHEKWDGTGYPRGLKGEQIPLAARLFALADVWDAVTSNRPYREAWSREKALAYIREQSGKQFDPQAVEIFMRTIEET